MPLTLKTLQDRYLPALKAELCDLLAWENPAFAAYYQMMQYHIGWLDKEMRPVEGQAGKRVRPLLCLLVCKAAGGNYVHALPAAAGIETLHNFSLLHDDVEDNSDTRRGRLTVWKLWGVPHAINTGDGMFALAHLAFTRLPERGVPVERAFAALQIFDRACLALTHGQYLDIGFEKRLDVTVTDYLTMIDGKTAALVAASTHLGALLAGADEPTAAHFRAFGRHLGLAFQIRDDILGIWGDAESTGKSTSTDIETRKKTLPVVYGLEQSAELRRLYAADAIPPERVAWVAETLEALGARRMAEELAAEHHNKSLTALDQALDGETPAPNAKEALRELATSLLYRTK